MRIKRSISLILALILSFGLLSGCAGGNKVSAEQLPVSTEPAAPEESTVIAEAEVAAAPDAKTGNMVSLNLEALYKALEEEGVDGSESEEMALNANEIGEEPALYVQLMPEASGTNVLGNDKAEFDASNTKDGYVMARYTGGESKRIKALIKGPSGTTYQYNINLNGEFEVLPLSDGSGTYTIGLYQNLYDTKYTTLYATTISVMLEDEFATFLLPNQYVNYTPESLCVLKAKELAGSRTDTLEIVSILYNYVVDNFSYDYQLAATVKSGYLPDLDQVFQKKAGICFDYAATLTAMLRSLGIPSKLMVGYAGTSYHAWISVYTEESGWIDSVIYFNGSQWKLMDPTFASTSNSSRAIMDFINNSSNYSVKYQY